MPSEPEGCPLEQQAFLDRWNTVLAPDSCGYRIRLVSQLLYRRVQEKLDPLGLTPFHWVVLGCLWEEDGLATSTIGERLNQVGGTLTGVLDRMEARDLVQRVRDPKDRRIWRIWLTAEGLRLRDILPPLILEVRHQYAQGFSEGDYTFFANFLDQMILNISGSLDPWGPK